MANFKEKLAAISRVFGRIPGPIRDFLDLYFEKRITRSAAALSYFLTLSIFPFIIFINVVLGAFHYTVGDLIDQYAGLIPPGALSVIPGYLQYVEGNSSTALMVVGIFVMVVSSAGVFRVITGIMEDMQGRSRFNGVFGLLFSFLVAIAFLLVIYVSCVVIIGGGWLLEYVEHLTGLRFFLNLWRRLRFVVLFLLLYGSTYGIYVLTAPKEGARVRRGAGALLAALFLVLISALFSWMVGRSVKYTLVYGSIASIVILMVWLYLCSNVLLIGNIFNIVLHKYLPKRKSNRKNKEKSE